MKVRLFGRRQDCNKKARFRGLFWVESADQNSRAPPQLAFGVADCQAPDVVL